MKNKSEISIIIADDHPIMLKGLGDELVVNGYQVIGRASNGIQALELIIKLCPSVVILDIDMPHMSGFEIIQIVKDKGIPSKCILLTFHKEVKYLMQAKALKIDGYLLKEDAFLEIEHCIQVVLNDDMYFSSSFDKQLLSSADKNVQRLSLLTPSEVVILKQIAKNVASKQIAANLGISSRTVEKHRSNIISKLSLERETNALTNWALVNMEVILGL